MPGMATVGQKTFIKDLLEQLDTDLADFTAKEMEELTWQDASSIIDELKTERLSRHRSC